MRTLKFPAASEQPVLLLLKGCSKSAGELAELLNICRQNTFSRLTQLQSKDLIGRRNRQNADGTYVLVFYQTELGSAISNLITAFGSDPEPLSS